VIEREWRVCVCVYGLLRAAALATQTHTARRCVHAQNPPSFKKQRAPHSLRFVSLRAAGNEDALQHLGVLAAECEKAQKV
jgi:hypothetical protein